MKDRIIDTILTTIKDYNDGLPENSHISQSLDSTIYGGDSTLDSLGLVSFIVGLEQNIEDEFNQSISLADEKAMSEKSNPYRNINSLADYISKLLVYFKHMNNRIKRTNDELKADRPTLEQLKDLKRLPICILVENVRSVMLSLSIIN